jgi:hypothetical protein
MFAVDVLDVVHYVVEDGLAQQLVLTAKQPEQNLQEAGSVYQVFVAKQDQRTNKRLHRNMFGFYK